MGSPPSTESFATSARALGEAFQALGKMIEEFAAKTQLADLIYSTDGSIAEGDQVTEIEGIQLVRVHDQRQCAGQACVIHNPLDHHMRDWTLHWRDDRKIFERICPSHGCGHPDPSQFDYWESAGRTWEAVHGCCGCCQSTEKAGSS
ncbi:hypothetical protein HOT75_gp008 [Gordonia phage Daredevil]|uniref:Uncharacterized protein n=1 Tax=Gordonia phage Daredevil TaxID=2283286 RepID=A0A345MIL5_9CAUD|nr:hypothetical protein HOT75_gp008 [Gordonia phage Daredevil]AXH70396.1 hypothetical protein SEA_DAREDEVIL_8 [Gordonia phage Daredevil]